jgi:hypothetical protein
MVREVETALDPVEAVEAVEYAIEPRANLRPQLGLFTLKMRNRALDGADAGALLALLGTHLRDIAPDRPQHLQNQIVSAAAHGRQDAPGRAEKASAERAS